MAHSTTKVPVTGAELAAIVRRGFGDGAVVSDRVELTDGYYNATYRVHLADGQVYVLKVAPPPEMKLLTHEVDLMRTEVDFYRRAAAVGAPVPGSRWRRCPYRCPTWPHPHLPPSFLAMVDDILADATRLGTELPAPPGAIRARIARHAPLLDSVRRPALVHFDLWDGNVFVAPTPGGWRLTGMIDGERALFGDPYAEFVSIALFRDIRQLPAVLDGYAEVTGEPVEFTEDVRLRTALYTCYLYLIMVTEGPTRGFDPIEHDPTRLRALGLLAEQLDTL